MCTYVCTYVYMCMYACTYVCMYMHLCVYIIYIIILDPNDDDRAYVCNITPWLTPHFN